MSQEVYDELLEAGAPALREGWAYVVTRVNNSVMVQVVEKGRHHNHELAYSFALLDDYEVGGDGLLRYRHTRQGVYGPPHTLIQLTAAAARQAYGKVIEKEIEKARLAGVNSEIERLEGTHP